MEGPSEDMLVDDSVLRALREYRVADEPDPAWEVVSTFLEVTPARLERLHEAARRGDAAEVHAVAHMLSGSSGTVGARAMHTAAAELEQPAADDVVATRVAALEALFARTRPLLEALASDR